jgi:hypothetical protein
MTISELSRTPTVDWFTDELFRADEKPETDEDNNSLLTTQSINVIVVNSELQLAYAQH